MILDKNIDDISIDDLQSLIDDKISEKKYIEYKSNLPRKTHKDKKDFLADVSSFANASGGYIIYGMEEKEGIATSLKGIEGINQDEGKLRLENIIRNNIDPRISGIQIVNFTLENKNTVILVKIPRSWAQPHVVNFEGHWRFYSRTSAGKYDLDVTEVRAAINLSENYKENIKRFHTDRIDKIISEETPVPLSGKTVIVLHLIPIEAFDPIKKCNIPNVSRRQKQIPPIIGGEFSYRYNFEGVLSSSKKPDSPYYVSYTQLFRNGIIEATTSEYSDRIKEDPPVFPVRTLEYLILHYTKQYMEAQSNIDVNPPIFFMLSILGMKGFELYKDKRTIDFNTFPITKENIIFDGLIIEDFNVNLKQVIKPIFDTLWNAFGAPYSLSYDQQGNWIRD